MLKRIQERQYIRSAWYSLYHLETYRRDCSLVLSKSVDIKSTCRATILCQDFDNSDQRLYVLNIYLYKNLSIINQFLFFIIFSMLCGFMNGTFELFDMSSTCNFGENVVIKPLTTVNKYGI